MPDTLSLPLSAITGTFLHRAWLKSGRPDPLLDSDAWDGFALTLQALAEVERIAHIDTLTAAVLDFAEYQYGAAAKREFAAILRGEQWTDPKG